ncbi:hypothetical protein MTYP_01787 [Methylophilaceae bacterium]|nr:hypothetical protein MTYP_01787 [Methylophilaceae bacterium]
MELHPGFDAVIARNGWKRQKRTRWMRCLKARSSMERNLCLSGWLIEHAGDCTFVFREIARDH